MIFFSLSPTILQFFWNVVHIMETMPSPSPLQELNEVMITNCFSFASPLSITSLYLYDLVLKEREWGLGGLTCLQKVFPGKAFSSFLSCPPTMSTLSHKWNALRSSPDLSWGPLAPTKQSLPYNFHRNFNPVKTALLCEVLLGKEMSWEFSTSSLLLSDTHSGFGPPWWSGLSACWTDSLFRFWSYSEFSLILMYVFHFFDFLFFFLNHLWKRKGVRTKHLTSVNRTPSPESLE